MAVSLTKRHSGVTSIGNYAFLGCVNLQSVTMPDSIKSIGYYAFSGASLSGITIPGGVASIEERAFYGCSNLTSIAIPGSVTNLGIEAFQNCAALTNVTLADGLTSAGAGMFFGCVSLASVTMPASVTSLGDGAFALCTNLTSVYFLGDAPASDPGVFAYDGQATVYYLPQTTGWSSTFSARPAMLWNPLIQEDAGFGVRNNQFEFNITGTNNLTVVVQAATNLADPDWSPLQTITLTNGLFHFSEPLQTNSPGRFYRVSPP